MSTAQVIITRPKVFFLPRMIYFNNFYRPEEVKKKEARINIALCCRNRFFFCFSIPLIILRLLRFCFRPFPGVPRFGKPLVYSIIMQMTKWLLQPSVRRTFAEHTVCVCGCMFFCACMCADICISTDILKGNSNILESRGVITSETLKVTLREGQKRISFCCFECVCEPACQKHAS